MAKDRGREFLKAVELLDSKGAAVTGEPVKGKSYKIRMRPKMTFWGNRDGALETLAKSFPGCKFAWAKPAEEAPAE